VNIRVLSISAVILILGSIFTYAEKYPGLQFEANPIVPCQKPLTYRFGHIDPRFNVSKEDVKNVMKEVEDLWASALGRNLLNYSPNGTVVINLVYGKDQKRTENEQALSSRINILKKQVEMSKKEYQRLLKSFQKKKNELQTTISHYEELAKDYNKKIARWKTGSDIPKGKKQDIEKMKQQIAYLQSQIKKKHKNSESLRKRVNSKSKHLNTIIDLQNQMIAKYNNTFSDPQKFDQGRYIKDGNKERINIYQFSNRAELKTVLAHEAGHAMGLGHVDNPKSIMNAMMDKQDIFHLSLTREDIEAIRKRCQ